MFWKNQLYRLLTTTPLCFQPSAIDQVKSPTCLRRPAVVNLKHSLQSIQVRLLSSVDDDDIESVAHAVDVKVGDDLFAQDNACHGFLKLDPKNFMIEDKGMDQPGKLWDLIEFGVLLQNENLHPVQAKAVQRTIFDLHKQAKPHVQKTVGDGYESHHNLPTCLGGADSEANKALIPALVHVQAHLDLARIFPGSPKLLHSANFMSYGRKEVTKAMIDNMIVDDGDIKVTGALRAQARNNHSRKMTGKKQTDETRAKIGASRMGKKHTDEARAKIRGSSMGNQHNLGRRKTHETPAQQRQALIKRRASYRRGEAKKLGYTKWSDLKTQDPLKAREIQVACIERYPDSDLH